MTEKKTQNHQVSSAAQQPKVLRANGPEYRVTDPTTLSLSFEGKSYKVKDGVVAISALEAEPFLKAGFLFEARNTEVSSQTRLLGEEN